MKRLLALPLAFVFLALVAAPAAADQVLEASRKEKARRQALKKDPHEREKEKKREVLSNTGLKKTTGKSKVSQATDQTGTASSSKPAEGAATAKKAEAEAEAAQEASWRARLASAQGSVEAARKGLEDLNRKINELRRMSSAADDPSVRLRTSDELRAAEAEVPKAQQAIKDAEKGVTDLREEARKAGVPPGWLR